VRPSLLALWLVAGCSPDAGDAVEPPPLQAGAGGQAVSGSSGAPTQAGAGGFDAGGVSMHSAGMPAMPQAGQAPSSGSGGAAGTDAGTAGAAGASGSAAAGSGGTTPLPPDCKVSSPVSFKADIQPFLTASCGKAKGGGCHVTDGSSTTGSLCPDGTKACGFNHAYDWITAGSHNEFCKQTPAPIRYTVVLAVMKGANPKSCSSSRVMPPDGPPASACQLAAVEAWLAEPQVLQLHRADDTSPSEPYLMPPFN
jgi:hypothetical protein